MRCCLYSFSNNQTGGIIDFVMEFEGKSFLNAVEHLLGESPNITTFARPTLLKKEEKGELVLPDKAKNYKRVYWYLCSVRGIEPEIVSKLMNERKIYQRVDRGNCVFVGYNEENKPKYCSIRGTSTQKAFKMDKDNSDKGFKDINTNARRLGVDYMNLKDYDGISFMEDDSRVSAAVNKLKTDLTEDNY